MSILPQLWSDDSGQDIAEYAVMLAVILVLVVGTIRLVGSNANNGVTTLREASRQSSKLTGLLLSVEKSKKSKKNAKSKSKDAPRREYSWSVKASVMGSGSEAESCLATVAVFAQLGAAAPPRSGRHSEKH